MIILYYKLLYNIYIYTVLSTYFVIPVKRAPFTKTLLQKVAGGNLRENHFKHFEMILFRLSNPGPPWAESGLYEAHTSAGSE